MAKRQLTAAVASVRASYRASRMLPPLSASSTGGARINNVTAIHGADAHKSCVDDTPSFVCNDPVKI